jgi:hypothetical protein
MSKDRDMTRLHPEEIYVEDELAGTVLYIGKINLQDTWLAEVSTGSCKWASKHEAVKWVKKTFKVENE